MFWYVKTETKSTEKSYEKSEPTNKKVYVSARLQIKKVCYESVV
jgi:hypothetical protein